MCWLPWQQEHEWKRISWICLDISDERQEGLFQICSPPSSRENKDNNRKVTDSKNTFLMCIRKQLRSFCNRNISMLQDRNEYSLLIINWNIVSSTPRYTKGPLFGPWARPLAPNCDMIRGKSEGNIYYYFKNWPKCIAIC